MVIEVEPARMDAWMASQQGFFLCKRYPRATFNELLMTMMLHPDRVQEPKVLRLRLSRELRIEFLKQLRTMNIHSASLFPDLDGFARFLRIDWEIDRDAIRQAMENSAHPVIDQPAE